MKPKGVLGEEIEEEEGAAETMFDEVTATPAPLCNSLEWGREIQSKLNPWKKGGVRGRCLKIWFYFSSSYSDCISEKFNSFPQAESVLPITVIGLPDCPWTCHTSDPRPSQKGSDRAVWREPDVQPQSTHHIPQQHLRKSELIVLSNILLLSWKIYALNWVQYGALLVG